MSEANEGRLKRLVRRGAKCSCADHPAPGVIYCVKSGTLCDAKERGGCCELSYETNRLLEKTNISGQPRLSRKETNEETK